MIKLFKTVWNWLDDRLGISVLLSPMKHIAPQDSKWWYVFGSATLVAFIVQVASGVALAFSYISSSSQAYETLLFITNNAPFGRFLARTSLLRRVRDGVDDRSAYGADVFVWRLQISTRDDLDHWNLSAGLHPGEWDLPGSYSGGIQPRPGRSWSRLSRQDVFRLSVTGWPASSLVVIPSAAQRSVGSSPSMSSFCLESCLPLSGYISGSSFATGSRSRRLQANQSDPATYRAEYEELLKKSGKPFWPDLAWRDVIVVTRLIIAIAVAAFFVGPPALDKPPDPSILAADPRPDWYLLWYFALLALIPARIEGYVMIGFPILIGLLLLFVPIWNHKGERAASRRPWAIAVVCLSVIMIGGLWWEGQQSPWSPNFEAQPLSEKVVGATSGPVFKGGQLFHDKGCLNCHLIQGFGGRRGPDLTYIADTLTRDNLVIRILNGGTNMPAFSSSLKPGELDALVAFLETRKRPLRPQDQATDTASSSTSASK